eukprot:1153479-Pelagomonas_calceolata.AAC.1
MQKRKEKLRRQRKFRYTNSGKGDTLAQKSRESPPPQATGQDVLTGFWRVTETPGSRAWL